ncbi:GNAT family N-acetyltransferase [Bradyrhizobium sp. LTSPM299]|uniref:GNAT family N-acetyltransferase n=1 Tax=Bradyrhizobium sp. LTSPM299 TaxID=1619233 RepID=UPI0012E2ADB0|nr:GNAT family N-acetyltransferase [Bradyrhizobium sp. LTSPM299]
MSTFQINITAVRSNFYKNQKLTVERLSHPEALSRIAGEWGLLDRQTWPSMPFTSAAWIVPWWKHFRRNTALVRDELFFHIVRDGNGELVALVPLMRTFAPAIGPRALRILQFFGTDAALTEVRGVICRPEDHVPVVKAVAAHFVAACGDWDVFRWAGLHRTVDEYDQPGLNCKFLMRGELPDYLIKLDGSWDDLRQRVSANMRKNLRKAYDSLERGGINFALRVTERHEDVAAAFARFVELHTARAQAPDMILHPNKFGPSNVRAFFGAYLHAAAERGELRIFELEIGGVAVASRLTFLIESDLYMYFAGYDPAWKTHSVMTVLMAEIIKWAYAHGIEQVNLSTGHDQSKVRWKPCEILFREAVQVSPTRRAWAAFQLFRAYEGWGRLRIRWKP